MSPLAICAAALAGYVGAWALIALLRRDNSLADVAWGGGFILLAWLSLALSHPPPARGLLAAVLVTIWGLRLAVHILARNRGRGEDFRYAAWRRDWGRWWLVRSLLQVFVLQGVILFVVAAPVLVATLRGGPPIGWLDAVGVAVWLTGFAIEAIADWQLFRFRRNPANQGRVLDTGLWAWSRHPNYFGEACLWWGLGLVALAVPGGWVALAGPLLITFLLLRVSGVPLLEAGLAARKPGYAEYVARTSAFVPRPPHRTTTDHTTPESRGGRP